MDINWTDPQVVSLHERLARCVQDGFEDSLTGQGTVADPEHLGQRVATDLVNAAIGLTFSSTGWALTFRPDLRTTGSSTFWCATCQALPGQLHRESCHRRGILRAAGERVQL